jgi:hypothetical protein
VVAFGQKVKLELQKITEEKEKIEAAKAAVRQSEANNWLEKSRIRTDRSELENETAIIKRDHQVLEKREWEIRLREGQRQEVVPYFESPPLHAVRPPPHSRLITSVTESRLPLRLSPDSP